MDYLANCLKSYMIEQEHHRLYCCSAFLHYWRMDIVLCTVHTQSIAANEHAFVQLSHRNVLADGECQYIFEKVWKSHARRVSGSEVNYTGV